MAQQQQGGAGTGAGAPFGGAPTGQQQLDLNALRNHPQIQQLRAEMAANPAAIQPLIQQLAQQNPEIAQVLVQNPEALMQLLGVAVEYEDGEGEGGQLPPGTQVLNVTPEERAAIERVSPMIIFTSQ